MSSQMKKNRKTMTAARTPGISCLPASLESLTQSNYKIIKTFVHLAGEEGEASCERWQCESPWASSMASGKEGISASRTSKRRRSFAAFSKIRGGKKGAHAGHPALQAQEHVNSGQHPGIEST